MRFTNKLMMGWRVVVCCRRTTTC